MSMDYDFNQKPANGKSHVLTLLLAFFLGGLGIHRFYTGYVLIGILQLLTCGGCGIWALVDLLSIATGNYKDSDGNELEEYNSGCGLIVLIFIVVSFVIGGIGFILSILNGAR